MADGGRTELHRFVRITAEVRTVADVETWVRTALDNGPNGTELERPVRLTVEVPLR